MSSRRSRAKNPASRKPDGGLLETSSKRRKVVSYKEPSSSEDNFEEVEEHEDEIVDEDEDGLVEDGDEELLEDGEDEDLVVEEDAEAVEEDVDEDEAYADDGNEDEDFENGDFADDEEAIALPKKSTRATAHLDEVSDESDRDDSGLIDDNEDEIEDDKDLVREERLRMRRALAEKKLQEEKRLVLNKLLKRRVGANRGEKHKDMADNDDSSNGADYETPDASDERSRNEKKSLLREKLPRRMVFSADGGIIYQME